MYLVKFHVVDDDDDDDNDDDNYIINNNDNNDNKRKGRLGIKKTLITQANTTIWN